MRGIAHILDVSYIEHPREVATYSVPEEDRTTSGWSTNVTYIGYYNGGARVVDVSGNCAANFIRRKRNCAILARAIHKGTARICHLRGEFILIRIELCDIMSMAGCGS